MQMQQLIFSVTEGYDGVFTQKILDSILIITVQVMFFFCPAQKVDRYSGYSNKNIL